MSEPKNIAAIGVENIESLLAEMFDGQWPDNKMLLGTLMGENSDDQIQIQLLVTREHSSFMDEQ